MANQPTNPSSNRRSADSQRQAWQVRLGRLDRPASLWSTGHQRPVRGDAFPERLLNVVAEIADRGMRGYRGRSLVESG